MAQQPSTLEFEDLPLDEARRMRHGFDLDPELSHALTQNIQAAGPHRPLRAAP